MRRPLLLLATVVVVAAIAAIAAWHAWPARPPAVADEAFALIETPHYEIRSAASPAQTRAVADAVEALHAGYQEFFANPGDAVALPARLQLVLYRDQAHFKANNRSSPWAEAYYRAPACHAYVDTRSASPYHWMTHEAVHQLNRESSGFARFRWSDEGLATYFAASLIVDGKLRPGDIDWHAYPMWWLGHLELSGELAKDLATGRLVPLRDVVAGTGPEIGSRVNLYYLQFWSLTHFLLHHDGGRYRDAYLAVVRSGATLAEFEQRIGAIEVVQAEWYDYLRARIEDARIAATAGVGH